ncbi:MAG: zinc-dependent alcohol dehydrogenase [Victivallaceae bacterium]
MKKNPAVVFTAAKKAVIEELAIPHPGDGEVLIKSSCTMVSTGTEMTAFTGEYPSDSVWEKYFKFPYYPGYNNIGTVVETGNGTDKELLGKKIATWGQHAAYSVQKVENLYPINREIPDEHAVFFTIAEIVMNGIRRSNVRWGESVVVYGLGLLGQFTAIFARLCGAKPVFAADISDYRLNVLPEDSGILKINTSRNSDIGEIIKTNNRGSLADIVFEVTGNGGLIPSEFAALRPQGRFVLLSSPQQKTLFDFHDLCNNPSYTIIGAHNFSHPAVSTPDNPWTMSRHVGMFFDLVADGDIDVGRMISRKVDYTHAAEIYVELLKDRSKDMGIIIDWSKAGL